MDGIRLRAIDPAVIDDDDLAAVAALQDAVRDGGRIAFTARHRLPLRDHLRLLRSDSVGVLAEEVATGRPAGMAWVAYGRCTVAGRPARYALLNSLQVHPDFRRRGVAAAMTEWRLDHEPVRADGTGQEVPVIPIATIQLGNAASLANARRWARVISEPLTVRPVPMRRHRPRQRSAWTVRDATAVDLDVVATGLTNAYSSFALAPAVGAAHLRRWLDRRVTDRPLNRYVVITGPDGVPLAGLGLHDEPQHTELEVSGLGPILHSAARAARVVPASGVMRNLAARLAWCAEGAALAGRQLWQTVRYSERDRGTSIVTTLDRRHPTRARLDAPRWLPTTAVAVAMRPPAGWDVTGPVELPL